MFSRPSGAAKLAIAAVSLLLMLKVTASVITGSIGIRADAVHSFIDLFGVVIGFIGIRIAAKPPDERHAFGHGKAENIAGIIIAALIFIAAGTIAYEAVKRLISGSSVELVSVGIFTTAAAIVINMLVAWHLSRVARAADSVALEATARDLLADVLSSVAVLIGLILVRLTGLIILDPIVALLVAALIARTAYISMRQSFGGLMDVRLPQDEEDDIRACVLEHGCQLVGLHDMRTRKAGSWRYVEFHLVMPKNASVEETHQMCDHLEHDIANRLPRTMVTIHVEPCTDECDQCTVSCTVRDKAG